MRMFRSLQISKYKRQALPTRLARGFTALVMAATPLVSLPLIANALSDTTPMHFTSLSVDQSAVNVDNGDVQVNIWGPTEDDLSGYEYVVFYYTSPSGAQVYEGNGGQFGESTLNGNVVFRQFAEPGVWKPTFTLVDRSGNSQTLTSSELFQAGFNVDVTVTSSTPDLTPPEIVGTPCGMGDGTNIGLTPERVFYGLTLADDSPGTIELSGRWVSPTSSQVITDYSSWRQEEGGAYMLVPEFPPYSESGTWSTYFTIRDYTGNTRAYTPDDMLQYFGTTCPLEIGTEVSDITPLHINSLAFIAADAEFPVSGATVRLRGNFTDNLSGFSKVELNYISQTTTQKVLLSMANTAQGLEGTDFRDIDVVFPSYSATGLWLPEIKTYDLAGNTEVLSHTDLLALGYDLSVSLNSSVSNEVTANETVTTDELGTGATVEVPVQAAVTTPTGGVISVVTLDVDPSVNAMDGYALVGQQVSINAPEATVEAPLTLTFQLDSSQIEPGQNANNLTIFRDGVAVEPCVDQNTANPTPCVFSRVTLQGGDIEIKVHTVAASAWALAFPTTQAQQFKGFKKLNTAPQLNKIEAGETVPVKFNFGDGTDPNILIAGSPTTQEISCTTFSPIGEPTAAISTNGKGLILKQNDTYRYNWDTLKAWKNSCRKLTFTFNNGEVESVYFNIKKS